MGLTGFGCSFGLAAVEFHLSQNTQTVVPRSFSLHHLFVTQDYAALHWVCLGRACSLFSHGSQINKHEAGKISLNSTFYLRGQKKVNFK